MKHPSIAHVAVACLLASLVPETASAKPGGPSASSRPKSRPLSKKHYQKAPEIELDISHQFGEHGPDWKKALAFTDYGTRFDFRWKVVGAALVSPVFVVFDASGVELKRTPITSADKKSGGFTILMSDLPKRTTYRVRVEAANANDTAIGHPSNTIAVTLVKAKPLPFGFAQLNLESIRNHYNVPGLAVAISCWSGDSNEWVAGVRRHGDSVKIQPGDRWHIGSNTKAFTATMIGKLVEEGGHFDWNSTVWSLVNGPNSLFPELRGKVDVHFKHVTLEHLASHRSGVKLLGSENSPTRKLNNYAIDPRQFRSQTVTKFLTRPHAGTIGEWRYGEGNYMILGAIIERVRGKSYESVIEQEILKPAKLSSAKFGMPTDVVLSGANPWVQQASQAAQVNTTKQPNGHKIASGVPAVNNLALPPVWNPAGGLYLSMGDMLSFLRLHIDGKVGNLSLTKLTQNRLHSVYTRADRKKGPAGAPAKKQSDPGYGWGWGQWVDGAHGQVLGHDGTYHRFYASMRAYLDRGYAVAASANIGPSGEGELAVAKARDWGVKQAKLFCKKSSIKGGFLKIPSKKHLKIPGSTSAKRATLPHPAAGKVKTNYDVRTPPISTGPSPRTRTNPRTRTRTTSPRTRSRTRQRAR